MDTVVIVLGFAVLAFAVYGYFKEHWNLLSAGTVALAGCVYIVSGIEASYVGAIVGTLIVAAWLPGHVRERDRTPKSP